MYHVTGTPRGEEKEEETGAIFEAMGTENCPKFSSDSKPQIQGTQKTRREKILMTTLTYIIFELQNIKDKGKYLERIWGAPLL